MKKYRYKAKRGTSEACSGTLAAETREEAIDQINELGLFPIEVEEEKDEEVKQKKAASRTWLKKKVNTRDLAILYRQLAKLIKSGVPILRALVLVSEQSEHPFLKEILMRVQEMVREGTNLSSALATYEKVFSVFDIAMIGAGESVGRIDESLTRIADYREQQNAVYLKIKTALAYPLFVIVAGAVTLMFMMSYVIPKFSKFFLDLGQNLPLITRLLIDASDWTKKFWYWVPITVAAVYFFISNMRKRSAERMILDRLMLKIPKAGDLITKSEVARLSRTLALLLKSGMPVLNAMKIAVPVMSNEAIKKELVACAKALEDGKLFSESLRQSKLFPPFVSQLIGVGEESGKLDEALAEVAGWYEQEIDETLKVMTNLLEPVIILVVGLILGIIIVAILLPVFSMNAMVQ
jgi:type II secretory pathway component PulF